MSASVASATRSFGTLLKNANKTRSPEDSIALRAVTLAAVMTGALALISQGAVNATTSMVVLLALPAAYVVSYLRRRHDNYAIKIAVTIGACVALSRFLGQMRAIATLDEVRFPLADLFLWVQVLHGFDLPARKDLNFSLGASLTLMAVAGSLSQDMRFAAFAVVYLVLVVYALVLSHRSELSEGVTAEIKVRSTVRHRRHVPWDVAKGAVATLAAGAMLFMIVPQPSSVRSFSLPFSFGGGIGIPANGGIANPGFTSGVDGRSSGPAYYGFADRMDLRVRGDLSDDLVMRVRASAPAMWRGMIFDSYDGVAWTGDRSDISSDAWEPGDPFYYPPVLRSMGPRVPVQQTFYIEAEQPSAIFSAAQPEVVWFDGSIGVDEFGALRTQSTLSVGTVYSVVSTRGSASPEQLRSLPRLEAPEAIERYLELPATVPQRVRDLAARITTGATNDYDRVKAIEKYLADNYEYSLDSPIPAEGRDAVDHFLFDSEVGFCEQFASATAVMLRSLGIPARVVAGYTPGSRNAFTGYYEVRNSDAHAWVEVWFPGVGWYEFDPTFAVPVAERSLASSIPLVQALDAIVSALKTSFPGGLKTALFSLSGIVMVVGLAWAVWRRRRRETSDGESVEDVVEKPPGPITYAFRKLESSLAAKGAGRAPQETAAELVRRVPATEAQTSAAVRAFERERYAKRPPSPDEIERAVEEFDRLSGTQVQE
jgi:transglutaminase-like putative cysteine protease